MDNSVAGVPGPTLPSATEIIEFPEAALAGFLSAEIQSLRGTHPEVVYKAIRKAQFAMGLRIYIDLPGMDAADVPYGITERPPR
jgi:hypothetical protein